MHLIFVGKEENQFVQARTPVECQKHHCKIDLKCKKMVKHWWDVDEKSRLENKKTVLKLYVMWVSVKLKKNKLKTPFSPSLHEIKEIVLEYVE